MADGAFIEGLELLAGAGDWGANEIRAYLVNADAAGPAANSRRVTAQTNVAAPVFTTGANHGLSVGDWVVLNGHNPSTLNGVWQVATTPAANTFTLTGVPGSPGAMVAGGFLVNLNAANASVEAPSGARAAVGGTRLTSKTNANGQLSAAVITWSGVAGGPDTYDYVLLARTHATDGSGPDATETNWVPISAHFPSNFPLPANPGTVNWTPDGTNGLIKILPK
jgi:hypothetical protein